MKSEGFVKKLVAAFIVTLALYIIAFHAIEDRRKRNGPWQITFTTDAAGVPTLWINQPRLGITNVLIAFPGAVAVPQTNGTLTLLLNEPREVPFPVLFGQCVFMDATSLPGTMVFELFGHEVQLLPRVLTIDKTERPWKSDTQIDLPPKRSADPEKSTP
ncbi:MAG: hypothetical protein U1F65_08450 [Verrucomicrobiota bacterium]